MKVRSRAPLRLGLAGGGTDVPSYADEFGGCVLNATVGLYVYCTLSSSTETQFRSEDLDLTERDEPALPLDAVKLRLHHATHRVLCERYPDIAAQPVSASTFSEVPAGSGLGTSSTIVVALVDAYRTFFSLPLDEYGIAALAVDIERNYLGQAGGLQDQYAAAFGGINFIEFTKNRVIVNPLRIRPEVVSELESHLVMFFTGQSRDSARIIADQSKAVGCSQDALKAMHRVKDEAFAMKEALLRGSVRDMASVLQRGWDAKKATSAHVTNSMTEEIYNTAMACGALSGKISGAGGGGFMFFVVEPENRARICGRLNERGLVQYLVRFTGNGVQSWLAKDRAFAA